MRTTLAESAFRSKLTPMAGKTSHSGTLLAQGARLLPCSKCWSVRSRVLPQAPGRALVPLAHGVSNPRRRLICVARSAGVGNFVFVGHGGRNEPEGVSVNHRICRAFRFNRGHVASDALTTCAPFLVVRVFLDGAVRGPF